MPSATHPPVTEPGSSREFRLPPDGFPARMNRTLRSLVDWAAPRPLLAAVCSFACGILLGSGRWVDGAVAALALGWAFTLAYSRSIRVALGICFAAGWLRAALAAPAQADVSRWADGGIVTVAGQIASDVREGAGGWSCQLAAEGLQLRDGTEVPCSGRVHLRLSRDSGNCPELADRVAARGRLQRLGDSADEGAGGASEALVNRGVFASLSTRKPVEWRRLPSARALNPVARAADSARHSLRSAVRKNLPPAESGLLLGMLIGDRSGLPAVVEDDFVATGTVHVLATAGLHVGIFVWGALFLLRRAMLPRWAETLALLAAIAFYAELAGGRPSVSRAALIGAVYAGSRILRRDADLPSALALAAGILLAAVPGYLFDAGFQLSFATVGCLIAAAPVLETRILAASNHARIGVGRRIYEVAASLLIVSFVAQAATWPLTAQHFHEVSLLGVPANAVIVLTLFPLIPVGAAIWGLGTVAPPLAAAIARYAASPMLALDIGAARLFAQVPGSTLNAPSPGWVFIALYYAGFLACVRALRARRRLA